MDFSFLTIPSSFLIVSVTFSWIVFLVASLKYKPRTHSGEIQPFSFSIIIPAHNERRVIKGLVTDFLKQTYSPLEIIVVCHNCTDGTSDVIKKIRDKRLKILEFKTAGSGKALALNEGLKHAKGNIVVQMDADNRVDDDFLAKALRYFSDSSISVIQVQVSTTNPNFNFLTKYQQLEYKMFGNAFWEGRDVLNKSCTIGGTGVMYRRYILEEVNGWDNELIEDYDLYCKLNRKGIKVVYASNIECFDEKPPYWSDLIQQRARWIRGHFAVMRKRIAECSSLSDLVYMISPLFYIAWYLCSFLIVLYLLGSLIGVEISYWYCPAYVWITSLIIMYTVFVVRLIREKKLHDLLHLPIYFLFSFHWLVAFLKSFTIKTWLDTKTEHGYATS